MFGLSTSQGFGHGEVGVEENHNGLYRRLWVWQSLTLKDNDYDFLFEKHFFQYMGNVGIYSMGRDLVYQIWQIGKIECFTGISREGLTCETLVKTSCHHLKWLFTFQLYAEHVLHFAGSLLASYSRKHFWSSMSLEFSHSLSHTTLTMKSHIKYRIQKIEQNYNQIWHGIKSNTN